MKTTGKFNILQNIVLSYLKVKYSNFNCKSLYDLSPDMIVEIEPAINEITDQYIHESKDMDGVEFVKQTIEDVRKFPETEHMDKKAIAIDFDNTLVNTNHHDEMSDIPGAAEAIISLQQHGYSIIIHSCRLNRKDGAEVIEKWLQEHNIKVDGMFAKPHAMRYIDDRGINFDGNWENTVSDILSCEEHQAPLAQKIKAGYYSFKDIAEKVGLNPFEFDSDMREVISASTSDQKEVVTHRLKAKYGMIIKQTGVDSEYHLRSAIANVLLEDKDFHEHDCAYVKYGEKYGYMGEVVSIDKSDIHVLLNGDNVDYRYMGDELCKIPSLHRASLYTGNSFDDKIFVTNEFYPNGLTKHQILSYYQNNDDIGDYVRDTNVACIYDVIPGTIPSVKKAKITSMEPYINGESNLVSFGYSVMDKSNIMGMDIDFSSSITSEELGGLILAGIDQKNIEDVYVLYNGPLKLVAIYNYKTPVQTEQDGCKIVNNIRQYAQSHGSYEEIDERNPYCFATQKGITIKPICAKNDLIPVPYSISPKTGLAYIPLNMENLTSFDFTKAALYGKR